MKIVNLKCPDCNASLEISPDNEYVICKYCGAKVFVQDENESKTERLIKRLGTEVQKTRNYYSSEEYKKRNKEQLKQVGIVFICLFIILAISLTLAVIFDNTDKRDTLTCEVNDKKYFVIIDKEEGITCSSCTDEMVELLKEKYFVPGEVQLTKKNIESYYNNLSGKCN